MSGGSTIGLGDFVEIVSGSARGASGYVIEASPKRVLVWVRSGLFPVGRYVVRRSDVEARAPALASRKAA